MSINMNLNTPHKAQLAEVLRRIADMIATSNNKTVTVHLDVIFDKDDC